MIYKKGYLTGPGYYKNPEATKETYLGEWFTSGDMGYFDDEGFLYIVDRKKDMVISGGVNIYPSEIEDVILSHPSVSEVAVVGIPDEEWGESLKAIVVKKPGKLLSEQEVIEICKENLASLKKPKSIEFWDELPKNVAGKILRREIRAKFWVGRERKV